MSRINKSDIDSLLDKWYNVKIQIAELEKKQATYKKYADAILREEGKKSISNSKYTLRKANITRNTLTKKDVPDTVWHKYSREMSYTAYYLRENKKK